MELGAERKLEIPELLEQVSKRDLYAHSKRMWNRWTNRYAFQFLDRFDIMLEAKDKPRCAGLPSRVPVRMRLMGSARHHCEAPESVPRLPASRHAMAV